MEALRWFWWLYNAVFLVLVALVVAALVTGWHPPSVFDGQHCAHRHNGEQDKEDTLPGRYTLYVVMVCLTLLSALLVRIFLGLSFPVYESWVGSLLAAIASLVYFVVFILSLILALDNLGASFCVPAEEPWTVLMWRTRPGFIIIAATHLVLPLVAMGWFCVGVARYCVADSCHGPDSEA